MSQPIANQLIARQPGPCQMPTANRQTLDYISRSAKSLEIVTLDPTTDTTSTERQIRSLISSAKSHAKKSVAYVLIART